jgi:hypothetical protein
MINGGIHGHSIEIGVESRFSLKLVDGAKELNEYLLYNIKGFLSVSDHPIGNSIHLLIVLIEDFSQRILIPLLTSRDQLGLINIHGALTFLDENWVQIFILFPSWDRGDRVSLDFVFFLL